MPDVYLRLPYRSIDDRINTRTMLVELRGDPNVLHVATRPMDGVLVTTVTVSDSFTWPSGPDRTFEIFDNYRIDRPDAEPELAPNQNGDAFPPLQRFFGALQGEPLRRNRDYQATRRPVFLVDEIPFEAFPTSQVDPRVPVLMDQRDYDDLIHWASNVIQTKSVLPQPEIAATPEPEPPTFWDRLLKDE